MKPKTSPLKPAQYKLITCVLYRGGGNKVVQALHQRGLHAAGWQPARGSAIGDPETGKGLPAEFEKDILSVVVPAKQADEIFQFVFETANIDRPYGGILYMSGIAACSPYVLPSVPEETHS